jgi:phage gp29-like protein
MGSQSTGSLAMHKDKSSFFLMALEATSDNIADTMTQHLLKPWVDYNWRVKEYPRMKYSRLDTRDTTGIADAVNKLVSVGAMTPGEDTERELRVLIDFPEERNPYETAETPETAPEEGNITRIAAIQERQIARVKELIASGKAAEDIRLPFKEELIAAIAEAPKEPAQTKISTVERDEDGRIQRIVEEVA